MTRPFSASTMSGNFDFPPANAGQREPTLEERRNFIQSLRPHRDAVQRQIDEVARLADQATVPDERWRLRMQQSAVREEIRRRHASADVDTQNNSSHDNTQAPTSAMRLRMENGRQPERVRVRYRVQNRATPTMTGGDVQRAVERLNEASSNLTNALEQPIPRIGSPEISAREYSGEAEMNRRRKRRKLESDAPNTGHMNGFSYGFRGQAVPGPLVMELVSCDGGIHTDAARNGKEYWPENVLRNDKSVYCTDSNKCNIVLRHMGETPFCLKKLVIKAPERGFTAPIQEGMVFVSMNSRDLLHRTSQYQMRTSSPPRYKDDGGYYPLRLTFDGGRPRSRRRDSGANRAIPPPISDLRPRSAQYNHNDTDRIIDPRIPPRIVDRSDCISSPQPFNQPESLGFNVTTTCDDPSSDEEEPSSAATLADLFRRDRLPPPYASSTDEDEEDGLERAMRRAGRLAPPTTQRRSRRRAQPSKIEVTSLSNAAGPETEVDSVKDVLAPHARFFIEREKSVVSIKFDPPVSGKFILLKLWSPARDQNIDIQSIICQGYAGPRFFPAASLL